MTEDHHIFPDDGSPVPALLTSDEACRFLRLVEEVEATLPDNGNRSDAKVMRLARGKLSYLSDAERPGHLRPTRAGKTLKYSRAELLRFIDPATGPP